VSAEPVVAVAVPAAEPARLGHLRVVDPERRRRARSVRRTVWGVVALVAAAVFGAVAFHVDLAQSQVRLDRLDRDIATAQHEYELLRLQVAQASAPETIVDRAKKLGMVEPGTVTYLTAPTAAATDDSASARGWATVKPHLAPQR